MHAGAGTPAIESAAIEDAWRRALWILEALPPGRPVETGEGRIQRRRKLAANLRAVVQSRGAVNAALHEHVLERVPFMLGLMWWASRREVEHEVLHDWNLPQTAAGRALVEATGSVRGAHAALADHARARAGERDDAFSESRILAEVVRSLQAVRTDAAQGTANAQRRPRS